MPLTSSGEISFHKGSYPITDSTQIIGYLEANNLQFGGWWSVASLNNSRVRHIANQGVTGGSFTSGTISMSDLYSKGFGIGVESISSIINLNDSTYGANDGWSGTDIWARWDVTVSPGAIDNVRWKVSGPGGSGQWGSRNQTSSSSGRDSDYWTSSSTYWGGAGAYTFSTEGRYAGNVVVDSGPFTQTVNFTNNTSGNGIAMDGPTNIGNDWEVTYTATAGPGSPSVTVTLNGPWGDVTGTGSASWTGTISSYGNYTITGSASGYGSRSIEVSVV